MADEAGLAQEITATAEQALQKAAEVIQRRCAAAEQGLQAAKDALRKSQEQAAAIEKADLADRARLLAETAKAAEEALKASYTAVDATYSGTPNADAKDEWKECRATIDRFDKLLVELRKTGFGIVTALVAAATFMFKDGSLGLRISILCMLVLLIITLYTIDRVHQVWLGITVEHAKAIEGRIGFRLTREISEKFEGRDATLIGFVLYFVMLVAACAMTWSSIPLTEEHILGGHRIVIYVAASTGLIWMASLQLSDSIQAFRVKLLWGMGILMLVVVAYVLKS